MLVDILGKENYGSKDEKEQGQIETISMNNNFDQVRWGFRRLDFENQAKEPSLGTADKRVTVANIERESDKIKLYEEKLFWQSEGRQLGREDNELGEAVENEIVSTYNGKEK